MFISVTVYKKIGIVVQKLHKWQLKLHDINITVENNLVKVMPITISDWKIISLVDSVNKGSKFKIWERTPSDKNNYIAIEMYMKQCLAMVQE